MRIWRIAWGLLTIWLSVQQLAADPLDVDSLKRMIAIQNEEQRPLALMASYKELGLYYYEYNNNEDALFCFQTGLELAQRLEDYQMEFFFLHYIGAMFYNPGDDYNQSLENLLRAEKIANRVRSIDSTERVRNYVKIAEVFNTMGNFEKALEYNLEARELAEEIKDTASLALSSRIFGVIYWGQNKYDEALRNFRMSLDLHQQLQQSDQLSAMEARENGINYYTTLASIGVSYLLRSDSLDKAKYFIDRSHRIADSLEHSYGKAYSEALMGNYYQKRKDYDEALVHMKEAVSMVERLKLKRELVLFTIRMADLYMLKKQNKKAGEVLRNAEQIAENLNSPNLLRNIYYSKSRVYEKEGNIQLAYVYFKKYHQLKDSLTDVEGISQLAKVEQQFVVDEKDKEIEDLQKAQKSSNRLMVWLAFFLAIFFLGVIIALGYQRNKQLLDLNQILEQKNDEIRRQNERLASSNEDLRQFAHVSSHDLREPLRSIGCFASLLKNKHYDQIDEESNEFIDFIVQGVDRMDKLLSDLLAYSVVGIFQTDYEEVDINYMITDIIGKLKKEKGSAGVKIKLSGLPIIQANKGQITQLFQHLIDNAIKFRSDKFPQIEIRAEKRGRKYLFSVEDNGIGMEKEYKEKIFGLFLRLHNRKSQYQGTGVGLSICKKIVEQHKGRIWIDSEPGVGTTVFFTLPENPEEVTSINTPLDKRINRWEGVQIN
ncbi:MAG: ATP-binding protein [Bacteroidota bacterium]